MKLISIVIATFNRKIYLRKILTNIYFQELPDNIDINIIIVVDGSTDGTFEMLRNDFQNVDVVQGDGSWWWTKSMNAGFKKAVESGSDFVLVLNDDVEIESDYLKILINDYKNLPDLSILGSASISIDKPHKIESAGTKHFKKWRMKAVPYFSGHPLMPANFSGVHPSYTLSGRGTLIPVGLFKRIGFYDEKLVQYGSDDEFCLRAIKNNYNVYISWNARILNHTSLTSKGSAFNKDSFYVFFKSFFNKYSVNSLFKAGYLYKKYGVKLFYPFYLMIFILGTLKAYLFNYKNK